MLDNVKNMISDKVAEFLALKCDFWILVVLALVMLIIFIVLLKSRLRLDYKFTEAESAAKEEIDGIRTRAEREISEAKKAAEVEVERSHLEAEEMEKTSKENLERLRKETNRKVTEMMKASELEILQEKDRSKRALAGERESIKTEAAELSRESEKDLLIRAILALSGYGTRLDRLEESLSVIENKLRYQEKHAGTEKEADKVPTDTSSLMEYLRADLHALVHGDKKNSK